MSDQRNFGTTAHTEYRGFSLNGWFMLPVVLILFCSGFWLLQNLFEPASSRSGSTTSMAGLVLVLAVTLSKGLFVLQPNESAVLLFFGSYQPNYKSAVSSSSIRNGRRPWLAIC